MTMAPSQVRLIFYCLAAIDRVIHTKFTNCFRSALLLLNPKTLHALHLSLGALFLNSRGRHVGGVISWGRHDLFLSKGNATRAFFFEKVPCNANNLEMLKRTFQFVWRMT